MWALLSRKWQVTIILAAGFLLLRAYDAADSWFNATPLTFGKSVSLAAFFVGTILSVAADLFWRHLWRFCPKLQVWTFPDLNGKWTGTLISTWINPETGAGVPPIPTEITIYQTLFSTNVRLKTGESESVSGHVVLERFPETKRFRLWYTYHNKPKSKFHFRSTQHEGVAYLDLVWDDDPDLLCGHYYTGRKTSGDIEVRKV